MTESGTATTSSAAGRGALGVIGRIGLIAGPFLAFIVAFILPTEYHTATGNMVPLTTAAHVTAALSVWMAVWWMTEAIPVYATALLPIALLPLLGAGTVQQASSPYGNEMIFLFLGGFMLALSMQRWGLDRRIAFAVLRLLGNRADLIVLGLMAVTAGLSMWVSNTASMLTMFPVALSVLALAGPDVPESERFRFSHVLLLGVAYAASIGGMASMIGTPPNLFLVSLLQARFGIEIGFGRWLVFGVPLMLALLPLTWWLLLRFFPIRGLRVSGVGELAGKALGNLGSLSRGEKVTVGVFIFAVVSWVFRPLLTSMTWGSMTPFAGLTDAGVAILAALILFVFPAGKGRGAVLNWEVASKMPFGLLLLFGGGLSLAAAIERNGLGDYLGQQLSGLQAMPMWAFIALVAVAVLFLGELLSNTAMAATVLPICASVAVATGWNLTTVLIPITLAASCGFMLPVATPPNAIVYGSGRIDARAMAKVGFWLNLLSVALILALMGGFSALFS